jgi:hypothetical protein
MFAIGDEVIRAAQMLQVKASFVPSSDAQSLRAEVCGRFASGHTTWLWQYSPPDHVSLQNAVAWRWISEFVASNHIVMFFNLDDDYRMIRFEDGKELIPVIDECGGFEFYVTNDACEYLLSL